jgi:Cys-rich repeat protein
MLSQKIPHAVGLLAAGWLVAAACGGSTDSTPGAGGAGGGGTGTTVGTGGTAVTGTGGTPVNDGGRIPCGTANNGTGCNPNGNNRVCDIANNRCVQCTSNADCLANPNQMGNPFCDTVGTNMAGLPNDTCEECLTNTDCGAGMVCLNNNCQATCASDADCAATPNTPVCNLTGTPPQCVQCTTNAQCAGVTDMNGVPRPFCRLPMTNNAFSCRACITTADCAPGLTCSNGGNCNMPFDGGRGGGGDGAVIVDASGG